MMSGTQELIAWIAVSLFAAAMLVLLSTQSPGCTAAPAPREVQALCGTPAQAECVRAVYEGSAKWRRR